MPQHSSYAQIYLPIFHTYQEELLTRLETLVNIDSGTGQVEGVNQIMAHLEQWLRELDFTVTLHPTESFGCNLVARRKGKGRTRILLVGHVDTVYPVGAVQAQPFAIRDGMAYGPGVIDMKSGVMMCIYAMRALAQAGFDDYGELCIVFNNDEEVSSVGSTPLLREIAQQVDVGLVLEPSSNASLLTKSRKGTDRYLLEVFGVAAHSGADPQKGRSATIELAHKMIAIHNLNTLYRGVTFNVTRLGSSEPLNVIPDRARCHISVRAYSTQGLNRAADALERITAGCSIPDTRTVLTRTAGRSPYESTPQILELVKMAQLEGEGLGLQITAESRGGVSDANTIVGAGIPALDSLGPTGGGTHNLDLEHLRIDTIPVRGALLSGLIQRICQSGSSALDA